MLPLFFVPPVVVTPDIKDNNEEAASAHCAIPLEIHPSFSITTMAATQFIPTAFVRGWEEGGGVWEVGGGVKAELRVTGLSRGHTVRKSERARKKTITVPRPRPRPQTILSCQSA